MIHFRTPAMPHVACRAVSAQADSPRTIAVDCPYCKITAEYAEGRRFEDAGAFQLNPPGRLLDEGEGVYRVLPDEADETDGAENESEGGNCVVLTLAAGDRRSPHSSAALLAAADRERRAAAQALCIARERLSAAQRRYVRLHAALNGGASATESAERVPARTRG